MKRWIVSPAVGLIIAALFIGIFNMTVPVAFGMTGYNERFDGDKLLVDVWGFKLKDCDPYPGSYEGLARDGDALRPVPFEFIDDKTPDSSKPVSWFGMQYFGTWAWDVAAYPETPAVQMNMAHVCGDRVVDTVLGPFPVPPRPA